MAILKIKPKLVGDSGSHAADWTTSYTRVFQVLATRATGAGEIMRAAGVALGDPYAYADEYDLGAVCNSLQATCDVLTQEGAWWTLTIGYGANDPTVRPESPFDMQPELSFSWAQYQRPAFFDRDGNPILNTAGDPFIKPPQMDDSRPTMSIVRNEPTLPDLAFVDMYVDSLNEASFFGAPAEHVKCSNIQPKRTYSPELQAYYWQVSYEFQFRREGWRIELLNQGFRELNAAGTATVPIYKDNLPITAPAPLGENGRVLPQNDDPVKLEYDVYETKDFSQLGFDAFYLTLVGG